MAKGDFRQRLVRGDLLIGTIVSLPSPEAAEGLARAGFDWLFVDTEHGAFDALLAQRILQAAGDACPCVVRVPSHEAVWIKKALDIGAGGVIVPQVNSAEQARSVVAACKYPPEGERGVGIARAHGYGPGFAAYVAEANRRTAVILQAEHAAAVENIEEIVQVGGVDAVLVGPYDLSASMGRMGQVEDESVRRAIGKVCSACRRAGVRLGIFGATAEAVKPWIAEGFNLIAVGTDTLFLLGAAGAALAELSA